MGGTVGRNGPLGCRACPGTGAGAGGGARPRSGGGGPADPVSAGAGGARSLCLRVRREQRGGGARCDAGVADTRDRAGPDRRSLAVLGPSGSGSPDAGAAGGASPVRRHRAAPPCGRASDNRLAGVGALGRLDRLGLGGAGKRRAAGRPGRGRSARAVRSGLGRCRAAGRSDRPADLVATDLARGAPERRAGGRRRLHADPDRAGGAPRPGLAADPGVPDRRRGIGTRPCPPRGGAGGSRGGHRGGCRGALPMVGPGRGPRAQSSPMRRSRGPWSPAGLGPPVTARCLGSLRSSPGFRSSPCWRPRCRAA